MQSILVVDDYVVTRRVIQHLLEHHGYEVFSAASGPEALEMLEANSVDLMICDIAMPEMTGIDLLHRLRADARFEKLPVIMLTASGHREDREMAEQAGANGFLTKPASSAEVLDTVAQYLS
jgi:CheY-like chemotaxis protein